MRSTGSGSYEVDFGGNAQGAEHLATIFPRKPEGLDVGQSESAHDIGEHFFLTRREVGVKHGALRPVDESGQIGVAVEIVAQLSGYCVARDRHSI
jgi:hypothetical protein